MRSKKLDALRGFAIVLMVAFHANYLLVHIFRDMILNISPIFWYIIGKSAVTLFLLVSGISFFLFIQKREEREIIRKSLKRAILLASIAIGISLITFFFERREFIIFGIIHFFAVSSVLILFFMNLRIWNILIGLAVICIGMVFSQVYVENIYLYFLGLKNINFSSADYYPIFPWFGVMLIGYGFANFLFQKDTLYVLLAGDVKGGEFLSFMGKNSLSIYILHIPILYVIFLFIH